MRAQFRALERLAKSSAELSSILAKANEFMNGHYEWAGAYHVDDLYRGRSISSMDELPTELSGFLNRSPDEITSYGRLNIPNQSLLYVSEIPHTVFNELGAQPDELIVMIRLCRREESEFFYISEFGMLPVSRDDLSRRKREQDIKRDLGDQQYSRLLNMRKLVNKKFKEKNPEDNEDIYKVTAALSQVHFRDDLPLAGVMYPSVETQFNTLNMALKPDEALAHYAPHSVALFRVESVDHEHHHVSTLKTGWFDDDRVVWDSSVSFDAPILDGMTFTETETDS